MLRRLRLRPRRSSRRSAPASRRRAIVALADTRVVVCPPGLGDDVQAIKAGTLEIADVLAVSKGDLPLAEQTAREMREMLTLRRRARRRTGRRASSSSARSRARGIDELLGPALDAAPRRGRRHRRARPPLRLRACQRQHATQHRPREARRPITGAAPAPTMPTAGATGSPAWSRATASARRSASPFRAGGPGRAEVAMTVDARHLNFNGGCHGGAIFALADSAFGLASNSHGPVAAGHRRAHHLPGGGRRRRHAGRARGRSAAQPAHRRLPDRCRPARPDGGESAVSSFTGTVYVKG